jgi:cytochrome P450
MQTLAELDLAYLPMEAPGFSENPWTQFTVARKQHPWLAQCAFGYVIHEYGAMRDLLVQDDRMRLAISMIIEIMGAEGTPWARMLEGGIACQTGEDHKRLRHILQPLFTPRQAKLNRERMREVMARLLDQWAPKGAFDFEEFVSNFPIGVVCSMIGAPLEEIPRLRSSLETLGLQFAMDPEMLPALQRATMVLDEFAQQVVADRRAGKRPGNGGELLDALLNAVAEGGMSERELYDLLIFLFAAGYDTSKNMMTWIMHDMLDRPDCYRRCAEDLAFSETIVEESFRYHSVANIPRTTTADILYRDVLLPAGTMLFFPVSVSGRDPSAFPDPDTYDPERTHVNRHLGFGRGAHVCLGQFIARAQIAEGLHLIAQRIRAPKLAAPVTWRPFYGVWGIKDLPIEFEPAPRARTCTFG